MASLTGIKADDIVRCDVRGQRFWALVTRPSHEDPVRGRGLTIRALNIRNELLTEFVTSRQVIGVWRRAKGATVDV